MKNEINRTTTICLVLLCTMYYYLSIKYNYVIFVIIYIWRYVNLGYHTDHKRRKRLVFNALQCGNRQIGIPQNLPQVTTAIMTGYLNFGLWEIC